MSISEKIAARDAYIKNNYPDFAQMGKMARLEILHEARLAVSTSVSLRG
jgi:hypothetical protein